jgi:hypothetical protein
MDLASDKKLSPLRPRLVTAFCRALPPEGVVEAGEDMIADQTELFRSLKDAEDWLVAEGFRLQPCDWRNAVGDDAGCYVNLRGPYDTLEGFRVAIKRRGLP